MDSKNEHNGEIDRSDSESDRSISIDFVDDVHPGVADEIARLNTQLAVARAKAVHELDIGWAQEQQRTSIWLFRSFAVILIILFVSSLLVLLNCSDERQVHVATTLIEIILAAVVAGYLGYMLAKPFEHRR